MEPPQNAAKPETGGFSWLTLLSGAMFVIVAVALRGVRWDETYEHAQIITGQVVYPRGHPLALYVHNAFSFQTLFSAFLLQGGLGSTYLCGLRNVLFLGLSIMPVSILAAGITRSTLAGFVASALLLQGIMLEFDGSYPAMIWPEIYSNGPIGGGVVLIAVAALALGWWRVAFFLAGVVPAIHVGQWPPLAGTVFFMAALALFRGRPDQSGRGREATVGASFGYAAAGMACTILFWFVHRHFILPLAETGPFAARAGAGAVWQGYTYLHDPHRAFPPGNGHVILIGAIVLCALGAVYGVSGRFRVACACLTIFCGLAGAAVWGIMAIHEWLGPHMPFLLIAWMPYRLINLVPPVALAVMVGAIVARWPARGWWFLMAALLVGALQPLWPYVLGAAFHQRYLAGGEAIAYGLYGIALVALAPVRGPGRIAVAALALIALLPLTLFHQFGAACVVAGIVVAYAAERFGPAWTSAPKPALRGARVALAVAAAALLWHQFQYRQHMPVTPFQQAVREALAREQHALLVGPPDSLLIQATTNQPVLAEAATPSLISYVPSIGPAIDQLYREMYGYGFTIPEPGETPPRPWPELWAERTAEAWAELATRYGITHVIAPATLHLHLDPVLSGDDYTLYAVASSRP